jgi:hypothetical protein
MSDLSSEDSVDEYWKNVNIGFIGITRSIHDLHNTIVLCASSRILASALVTRNCIQELNLMPGEFLRVVITRNNRRGDHFDIIFVDLKIRTQITDRTLLKLYPFCKQTERFLDNDIIFSKNFYISGKLRQT